MRSVETERLLEAVGRIRPVIQEHAAAAEANPQLSPAVVDAMYQAGLYGMVVPKARGGLELPLVEGLRVWERRSRG